MSIVLRDLCKNFAGLPVVNHVNVEIQDGEMFVLLGGSGSGKSTILRLIAGLTSPDGGSIHLHGKDVTRLPPQARGTGFVFQNYSIFKHMTVAENIQFGLRVRKVPRPDRCRRSDELMELVEMAGLGERYPSQLSGGQLQRVALARALAYEPAVLLLDEPFGALDVKIRGQLRRSLLDVQRQLKVTAILVTHDQEEGFELADRIGVLEKGRMLEVGTPQELYHRPSSQFVATFVGGGNVLVGEMRDQQIELGTRRIPLAGDGATPVHLERARVRLLARPENVEVAADESQLLGQSLGPGRVISSAFAGSFQRLRVELPDLDGVRCISPVPIYGQSHVQLEAALSSSPDQARFVVGQQVAVGLRHYHLLERTGLRSLIVVDWLQDSKVAVDFGIRVSLATGAPATLLSIAGASERDADLCSKLEELQRSLLDQIPNLKIRLRRGSLSEEVVKEAREGGHEMIVVGEKAGPPALRLGPWAQRLVAKADIPVLLVQEDRPKIERVLICSGGGEPGKGDVWLGGRVAKRAGASATVVHALWEQAELASRQRAQTHLARAEASLHSMGVQAQSHLLPMGPGLSVAQVLLAEVERGNYDLIVIGSPTTPTVAKWLIRGTSRPILFVPLSP